MSKRLIAYNAGIEAAKDAYKEPYQESMKSVAGIIAMIAMDAYEQKLRELNRRKKP